MQLDAECITTAVTALPPGWVNVYEAAKPGEDGALLFTEPCPAVMTEQYTRADGAIETTTRAAYFDGGQLVPVDDANHVMTTTQKQWATLRADMEAEVATSRDRLQETMLDRLREAGGGGVEAAELIQGLHPWNRACDVRDRMQDQKLVHTTRRDNPDSVSGYEFVYHLTHPAQDAEEDR